MAGRTRLDDTQHGHRGLAWAPSSATPMMSALEGAILIARAERDVRALTAVSRELGPLLGAAATGV